MTRQLWLVFKETMRMFWNDPVGLITMVLKHYLG